MVPKAFEPGYPNTNGFRKVVKATIYIKKKEGMSDEDFIEYYNNNHAQRAVPILQKHGVISYSLVCISHIPLIVCLYARMPNTTSECVPICGYFLMKETKPSRFECLAQILACISIVFPHIGPLTPFPSQCKHFLSSFKIFLFSISCFKYLNFPSSLSDIISPQLKS